MEESSTDLLRMRHSCYWKCVQIHQTFWNKLILRNSTKFNKKKLQTNSSKSSMKTKPNQRKKNREKKNDRKEIFSVSYFQPLLWFQKVKSCQKNNKNNKIALHQNGFLNWIHLQNLTRLVIPRKVVSKLIIFETEIIQKSMTNIPE